MADPVKAPGVKLEPEDLWYIESDAYDFSTWMHSHPGGAAILRQTRGSDVTALFHSYHTFAPLLSSAAKRRRALAPYRVRAARAPEVADSQLFVWEATPQYDELKRRVREHFAGTSHKAPRAALAWHAVWIFLLLRQALRWARGDGSALLLGVAIWYGAGDILHTGSHYGLFRSVRLNLGLAYTLGMLHHTPSTWLRQHLIGHHTVTNLDGRDPDMHHFAVLSYWLRFVGWRLSEVDAPRGAWSAPWWLSMPICGLITGIGPLLVETVDLLVTGTLMLWWVAPQYVGVDNPSGLSRLERACAAVQWAVTVGGIAAVGGRHGARHALTPFFVHGYLYYGFSQVSHVNEGSAAPDDAALAQQVTSFRGGVPRRRRASRSRVAPPLGEWAAWQFHASRGDWGFRRGGGRLGNVARSALSNGLNLQAVHHLFPNVHWWHYPALYPLVCEVLGEPEVAAKSYAQTFKEHLRFVAKMNDRNGDSVDQPDVTKQKRSEQAELARQQPE